MLLCARRIRRSTARALQNDLQRAERSLVGPVLTAQPHVALLAFAREHQNCQICHRALFSSQIRPGSDWAHSMVNVMLPVTSSSMIGFVGGSVMVYGGISLKGCKDIHVIANGTLTAVRYQDEVLRAIVRTYTGAVGSGFLLVQDNARPHVARVSRQFQKWLQHWCHWLTLMFCRPESNWERLGHYVWSGACPDDGLHTGMWWPYLPLRRIVLFWWKFTQVGSACDFKFSLWRRCDFASSPQGVNDFGFHWTLSRYFVLNELNNVNQCSSWIFCS